MSIGSACPSSIVLVEIDSLGFGLGTISPSVLYKYLWEGLEKEVCEVPNIFSRVLFA